MSVFVLDRHGRPLMPCSEKRARKLLDSGRARVHRVAPFVIRLTDREMGEADTSPLALKIDPGSQATGIALAHEKEGDVRAVFLAELEHRGAHITRRLYKRKLLRQARRGRHCRYRKPRVRRKPTAIAPAIRHRLEGIATWIKRLRAWAPVGKIVWESVGFDPPTALRRPEGECGMSLRERLRRRHGGVCTYCGRAGPFQGDHVRAKARGGSDSVKNRVLVCVKCNGRKSAQGLSRFLGHEDPRVEQIRARGKKIAGLRDAAAVNCMRRELAVLLQEQGIEATSTNSQHTAANRRAAGLAKRHAVDALLLGKDLRRVKGEDQPVLRIRSMGRGSRQRVRTDRHGIPRARVKARKRVEGFATGDLVRTVATGGPVEIGVSVTGRVAIRASGDFNVRTRAGIIRAHARRCVLVQRGDGYSYEI